MPASRRMAPTFSRTVRVWAATSPDLDFPLTGSLLMMPETNSVSPASTPQLDGEPGRFQPLGVTMVFPRSGRAATRAISTTARGKTMAPSTVARAGGSSGKYSR